MKLLIQRVSNASVTVDETKISQIGHGILVFLGVEKGDTEKEMEYLVEKTINLRIFESQSGRLDHSILDTKGEILCVSQFTLCADCKKGRRPDFGNAAPADIAKDLYEKTLKAFEKTGIVVKPGQFQTHMKVELVNDGPVTIMLDSPKNI